MFTPQQLFVIVAGMLAAQYPANALLQAILDVRALNAIPGYAAKLYGANTAGEIREFDIAGRAWSQPLAEHPMGAQAKAKSESEQRAEARAQAEALGVKL
jgi:hypothetical protein